MHEITSRLLADKIVATNNIKAPNPPLTTSIFGYVSQIGESYFPLIGKKNIFTFSKKISIVVKIPFNWINVVGYKVGNKV